MARAGYDPREAIGFWERMSEAGGSRQAPEFASTHPSHGTRIERLKQHMPKAMQEYAGASQASPTGRTVGEYLESQR
jgi:predicted Zn-dependent protease